MGFTLQSLHLANFRNHLVLDLQCADGCTVFVGANATGKSSLLEAMQLLSSFESFRASGWQELIMSDSEYCLIKARFVEDERVHDVEMLIRDGKREFFFNGKKRRLADMRGIVPVVIFTPDDLGLVKKAGEQRRGFIDDIGRQLSGQYQKIHTDYAKILQQRNSLLRDYQKGNLAALPASAEEKAWDDRLADLGAALTVHRQRLFQRLMEQARLAFSQIDDSDVLTAEYIPSFLRREGERGEGRSEELEEGEREELHGERSGGSQAADAAAVSAAVTATAVSALAGVDLNDTDSVKAAILQALAINRDREYARGLTLVGPHRDELVFYVNGRDARHYASQGQQRTVALSLKIAEMKTIAEISGNKPLLLLDDVFSELDGSRREKLITLTALSGQCFATTTEFETLPAYFKNQSTIVRLT